MSIRCSTATITSLPLPFGPRPFTNSGVLALVKRVIPPYECFWQCLAGDCKSTAAPARYVMTATASLQ